MAYSNQSPSLNKPFMHNGMVRVLPSAPHPFTLKREAFPSTSSLSPLTSHVQYQQRTPPVSPIPKLPPPPNNPRQSSALKRHKSLVELRTSQNINTNSQTPLASAQNLTQQIKPPPHQHFTFTQPQKVSTPTTTIIRHETTRVPTQPNPQRREAQEKDNNFERDTRKLHDEIALLKKELESMNKPMLEHDAWLKQQSEQVKELVQQQQQLQTSMSLNTSTTQSTATAVPVKKTPPPLPTSPKPTFKPHEKTWNARTLPNNLVRESLQQKQPLSNPCRASNDKQNSGEDAVMEKGENNALNEVELSPSVDSKSVCTTHKSVIDLLEEGKRRNQNNNNNQTFSSPEKVQGTSTINVRRISGLFEQGNSLPSTNSKPAARYNYNATVRRRQSFAPGISEKMKQLSPALQSENSTAAAKPTVEVTAKPSMSVKPRSPLAPFIDSVSTPENSILKSPHLLHPKNSAADEPTYLQTRKPNHPSERSLPLPALPTTTSIKLQLRNNTSNETSNDFVPPTPPTLPSTITEKPETHYLQLSSNGNEDKLSLSSMSSSSSYILPKSPESLDLSDQNSNTSKADLMEQIRQFGKTGQQQLKKASSIASDSGSTTHQHSPIHDALQSRFKAIYGAESDSGEGESCSDDENSDDWDD